eukprot:1160282-Pelagomonas_calceolata.AAC.10
MSLTRWRTRDRTQPSHFSISPLLLAISSICAGEAMKALSNSQDRTHRTLDMVTSEQHQFDKVKTMEAIKARSIERGFIKSHAASSKHRTALRRSTKRRCTNAQRTVRCACIPPQRSGPLRTHAHA